MANQLIPPTDRSGQIKSYLRAAYWMFTHPIVELEGVKIPIGPYMSVNMQHVMVSGIYEKTELIFVKTYLRPDDRVMELGTGIGLISTYCAKAIGSNKVWTFEANPQLEKHIRRIYKLNGVCPELSICMLGREQGVQRFYISKDFWTSSIISTRRSDRAVNVAVKSFNSELRRIDPTFLIIDIEGGEFELLKDADLGNVKKIAIEIHQNLLGIDKSEELKSKLVDSGFQIKKPMGSSPEASNEFMFVRS